MREEEQSLKEKEAELAAILNAYTRSHPEQNEPAVPSAVQAPAAVSIEPPVTAFPDADPAPGPDALPALPSEPVPAEDVSVEAYPAEVLSAEERSEEEVPIEAEELAELVTEAAEEEREALQEAAEEAAEDDGEEAYFPELEPPDDTEDLLAGEEAEAEEELAEEEALEEAYASDDEEDAYEEEEEDGGEEYDDEEYDDGDEEEYDDDEDEEEYDDDDEEAYDDDDDGDEIDEAKADAEEERRLSRFTRGCLEVAIFFAALAVLLLLLEQVGICIGYELPQLFLPLTMAGGSILALTVCLYSALRKALASFVLIVSIWFLIMLYAITNFQFPEVIPTVLPETNRAVTLTQITTPINANLCVDEILIPGVMSRRFKLPVHPKYVPLRYQVQVIYNEESHCNELYYNDLLWAVYDPGKNRWKNATSIGSMAVPETTAPPETAPMTRKPHRTGRSGSSRSSETTTTTTTTTAKRD